MMKELKKLCIFEPHMCMYVCQFSFAGKIGGGRCVKFYRNWILKNVNKFYLLILSRLIVQM